MSYLKDTILEKIHQTKTTLVEVTNAIELEKRESSEEDYAMSQELQDKLDILIARVEKLQENLYKYLDESKGFDCATIGKEVTIKTNQVEKNITLVYPEDADPRIGFISIDSPLGKAINGAKLGEVVLFESVQKDRSFEYKVTSIK